MPRDKINIEERKKISHNESEQGSRLVPCLRDVINRHLGQGKHAEFPRIAVTQGPPKSKQSQD